MKIVLAMMVQAVDLHFVAGFEPQRDTPMFLRSKNGFGDDGARPEEVVPCEAAGVLRVGA